MNPEEQLQDRLSRLEQGESLESCAADLPADEVELLKVVTALQSMVYPAQTAESIAAQRAILLGTAAERRGAPLLRVRTPLYSRGRWKMLATWPKSARVAVLGAAIVMIIAGLLLLRPAAPVPSTGPTASAVQNVPLSPTAEALYAVRPFSQLSGVGGCRSRQRRRHRGARPCRVADQTPGNGGRSQRVRPCQPGSICAPKIFPALRCSFTMAAGRSSARRLKWRLKNSTHRGVVRARSC